MFSSSTALSISRTEASRLTNADVHPHYNGSVVLSSRFRCRARNSCCNCHADPGQIAVHDFQPDAARIASPVQHRSSSKTDSPFTIDAGVFQIESDVANWTLEYEKGVRTRTWIIGNTNFKLGLTNWMDLQIFPQFYVNTRTSGPGFGKPLEQDGFGDTTIRLKINLLGNDSGKLVIGLVSSLKIPTNTGHTGNHVWEPGFGLPVKLLAALGFHAVRANADRYSRSSTQQ
jgi:Putative MetA-pathway of phenol degradation